MKKANFNHFSFSFSFFQQPNGPRSKKKKKREKAHRFGSSSLTRDLLGSERFRLNSLKSESDPRLSPTGAPTNTDPVLRRNYSFATLQITKPKLPVSQLRLNLRATNHRNLHISETFTTRNHKKIKTQFRTKTNRNKLFYIFLKRKYEI